MDCSEAAVLDRQQMAEAGHCGAGWAAATGRQDTVGGNRGAITGCLLGEPEFLPSVH